MSAPSPKAGPALKARVARPVSAVRSARFTSGGKRASLLAYRRKGGVEAYVKAVVGATPLERVEIERQGVSGAFIKEFSRKLGVPAVRVFKMLGVPRATAEKKAAAGQVIKGSGGQAAVGMIRLLGIAEGLVAKSTAEEAKSFDAAKWLGVWLERPQPALGGRKPGDLIDTPSGVEVVARLLGSIESGAYQ